MILRNSKPLALWSLLAFLATSWTAHGDEDRARHEVGHSSATAHSTLSHSAFLTVGPPTPKAQVQISVFPDGARHRNSFHSSRFFRLQGHHRPFGHLHTHGHRCYWIGGGYQLRTVQEWVPGYWIQDYLPPQYESFEVDGRRVQFLVKEGAYEDVFIPGHYETARRRVPLPGYWSCGY